MVFPLAMLEYRRYRCIPNFVARRWTGHRVAWLSVDYGCQPGPSSL